MRGRRTRRPASGRKTRSNAKKKARTSNAASKRTSKSQKGRGKSPRFDRLQVLSIGFFLVTGIIIARLFIIQVLQHSFYVALAEGQHELYEKLNPERGEVFARNHRTGELESVATSREMNTVYAVPRYIDNPGWAAEQLAPMIGISKEELEEKLSGDLLYKPLKRRVVDAEWEAIKALDIKGIEVTTERWRYYPEGPLFSHVTGFVGIKDDQAAGQYGLEGYFEEEMSGSAGYIKSERDTAGALIAAGDMLFEEAVDGDDFVLTIDKSVQYAVCTKLEAAIEKHGARKGSVIVMNPDTGGIVAMCNAPSFDPNNYSDVASIDVFNNDALFDTYEPGSVFKTFALGASLNEGAITPNTLFEDTGLIEISGYKIRNSDGKSNGIVDMAFVLAESLNTGSIYAVQQIGDEKWYEYLKDFGFGEATGIKLTGERIGDLSGPAKLREIYSATSSYGQGLTVTPLQLVAAYAAIANDGVLMKPFIVDEIIKPNGFSITTQPQEIRPVLSPVTSQMLAAMLVNVIDSGHAAKAGVDGYYMAGKTGTAQIPRDDGPGYDPTRHKDTFVGFGPVSDPKFVMLVKIDEPQDVQWSAASAAPLWGDIAKFLVEYYHIAPDR